MSRTLTLACSCRQAYYDASSSFTFVFWNDGLDALEEWGLDNPFRYCGDGMKVDGGELLRWWEDTLETLRAVELPTLYRVWREWQGPHGTLAASDAGYFRWRGTVYMAEDVFDRLSAVPMAPEVWEERRSEVPYDPPVVEAVAPEVAAALAPLPESARGEVRLSAEAFERIFRGTPLTLEHGELLDFYARELREIEAVIRHAAERGESVKLFVS